ncbi:acetyltransferase [Brevundimonas sp. Root1423]|uniref:acetyltransferase n=1 Tax=Brevundimonas sp. Root1423 TaxID=1736462 RepID=UPI0006F50322|nr:acetyltransferase [Brevundimonas sp. Root1423]KQY80406.1 acetyltransferase [Brevundimonas sp. Root1423]
MIRPSRPGDAARNLEIWRGAVDATHDFLSPQHRSEIDATVAGWLPTAELQVLVDGADRPLGFMALSGDHVDALFVDPALHGRGLGRTLIAHARSLHDSLSLDVNEQNPRAVGFYERLGFERTGRSPIDDQGRPYPLVHMALRP